MRPSAGFVGRWLANKVSRLGGQTSSRAPYSELPTLVVPTQRFSRSINDTCSSRLVKCYLSALPRESVPLYLNDP